MSNNIPDESMISDEECAPEVAPELSRVIETDQIKGVGYELQIEASEEERLALAQRFDLFDLEYLTANLTLTKSPSKSCIHLVGRFEAKVDQRCGITLEPVPADIEGQYECDYAQDILPVDIEIIEFDEETEEPPEPIVDNEFDVGIMLTEQFGLELDPFPRAPGADFDEVKKAAKGKIDDDESNNPFAVLKKLK